MKFIYSLICLLAIFNLAVGQSAPVKKEKKVVTIEKSTDKDGNEVIEKKILEGDAVKNEKIIEDGKVIRITIDSLGNKKEIIINKNTNDIRIADEDDDDEDGISIFGSGSNNYTERTVTIKKNDDGTVEIKEKSGRDHHINFKVDSTEAKKPNIGVMLNDDLKITDLVKGGAAEEGGLESGDVLTHIEGTFITDYTHLKEIILKKKIGDVVSITYLRDRKEIKSNITLKGGSTRIYFNR
ncbi:MAG: PDZ domain-containing protein [Saprospiraceae bacterium]|nr:PDZ domain-containing protein [Saprospiraceae bacterium]